MKLFCSSSKSAFPSKMKFSKMFFSSHLSQINQRNEELSQNFLKGGKSTVIDFSNFLRHVNKNPHNDELLKKFTEELPNYITKLDYLDTRKVVSIVLNNPKLHNNDQLLTLVKSQFKEARAVVEKDHDPQKLKIGADLKLQPYSVQFWAWFAKIRESFYIKMTRGGFNLK